MKSIKTEKYPGKFHVVAATRAAQAAVMTLKRGEVSDEKVSNEHPRSEQWLYVVSGSGTATVVKTSGSRRTVKLQTGSLLVIEKRERHQIRNTGWRMLRTINVYAPPAYSGDGQVKPSANKKQTRAD
jgi:mannose-6-phosphate isomerase-like protein (cupin superfamily)